MELTKLENALFAMTDMLKHIENVQKEIMELTEHTSANICDFIEATGSQSDETMFLTFQYQDIIAQKLRALNESVVASEKYIMVYLQSVRHERELVDEHTQRLGEKLEASLQTAKEMQDAFSGNALSIRSPETVEFF